MKTAIASFVLSSFLFLGVSFNSFSDISLVTDAGVQSVESGIDEIDSELEKLMAAESIIRTGQLDYDLFTSEYTVEAEELKLKDTVDEVMLAGAKDELPLGIPGFVWGFCFGILGLVVVYVSMEEGSERKKQATNAIWGCVAQSVLYLGVYTVLLLLQAQ